MNLHIFEKESLVFEVGKGLFQVKRARTLPFFLFFLLSHLSKSRLSLVAARLHGFLLDAFGFFTTIGTERHTSGAKTLSFFLHGFGLLRKIDKKKMIWRSLIIGIMSAEFALLIHFFVNNLVQSYIVGVPFWLLMGLLPAIGNIAEREKEVSDDQA